MAKKEMDTRFARFGVVSFTATTKVNDFIDYLEKGQIAGTRCKGCGRLYFPPRADCYQCLSSDMSWEVIEGPGKLVTYSQLSYAPIGFEKDLPYTIALLDFGECKVFGRIGDVAFEELKVGMELVPRVRELEGGRLIYTFEKP